MREMLANLVAVLKEIKTLLTTINTTLGGIKTANETIAVNTTPAEAEEEST